MEMIEKILLLRNMYEYTSSNLGVNIMSRISRKSRKLTPQVLRRIVLQEKRKMMRETSDPVAAGIEDPEKVSAEEVDAADQADTLEKDIDHMKVLKVHERKLKLKLKKIQEAKRRIRNRVVRKLG
jgi:hypothetical protein